MRTITSPACRLCVTAHEPSPSRAAVPPQSKGAAARLNDHDPGRTVGAAVSRPVVSQSVVGRPGCQSAWASSKILSTPSKSIGLLAAVSAKRDSSRANSLRSVPVQPVMSSSR